MTGAKSFDIGPAEIMAGMSVSSFSADGGFAGDSNAVNLLARPGALYAPGPVTDKSTSLVGEMLASCENPAGGGDSGLFVSADADQDGRFYSADSTGTLTSRGSEDTGNNYIAGITDMAPYKGEVYVTAQAKIIRWEQPATFDTNYFALTSGVPHPVLVYEDNLFYGNGPVLLRQTAAGGAPAAILTLPSNQVIIALGIDPGSGKMLLSIANQANASGTVSTQSYVGYYDGFSNKLAKIVIVDEMILAFKNVGGYTYITYGKQLGYWTGGGIQFLRQLDLTYDNAVLPYKQHLANIGEILYVIEKRQILAHGQVIAKGEKVFYYASRNSEGVSGNYQMICNLGQQRLGLGFATAKFFTFDTMSISDVQSGGTSIITNRYLFPRKVTFNQIVIQATAAIPAAAGSVLYLDPLGVSTTLGTITNAVNVSIPVTVDATGTEITISYPNIVSRELRFQILLNAGVASVMGINRITVFYNDYD
jgi:hypothetical protein